MYPSRVRWSRLSLALLLALVAGLSLTSTSARRLHPAATAQAAPHAAFQMLGRFGGSVTTVAVSGSIGVIGQADSLVKLNLSSTTPTADARATLPSEVRDLVIDGAYAYVLGRSDLTIWNISQPGRLVRVGRYALASASSNKIAVAGGRAYITAGGGRANLTILDVSDVAQPRLLASYQANLNQEYTGIAITGAVAYVLRVQPDLRADDTFVLDALNISTAAPQLLGSSPSYVGKATTIQVSNGRAYVTAGTFYVLNVQQPTSMISIGSFSAANFDSLSVQVVGSLAYIASLYGLDVLDISNAAAPTRRSHLASDDIYQDIAVAGGRAFVATRSNSLQVIAIGNPAAPTVAGQYLTVGAAAGLAVVGPHLFTADNGGLKIVDVSDPANPQLRGSLAIGRYPAVLAAAGTTVLLSSYPPTITPGHITDLTIVDVSSPSQPLKRATVPINGFLNGAAIVGNLAYLAVGDGASGGVPGLLIMDIANPSAPTLRGSITLAASARTIAVSGGYAYVSIGYQGLQIIDVSDPVSPAARGTIGGGVDGLVAAGPRVVRSYEQTISIINASDPTAPSISGSYAFTPPPYINIDALALDGDRLYVAGATLTTLIGLSGPSPVLESSYTLPATARRIVLANGLIYISDASGSLRILRLVGYTHTSFLPLAAQ